jgi:t-SNARE complex subunit (syntaxin)
MQERKYNCKQPRMIIQGTDEPDECTTAANKYSSRRSNGLLVLILLIIIIIIIIIIIMHSYVVTSLFSIFCSCLSLYYFK